MASAQHRAPPHDDSAGEPKTKKSRQQLSLVFQPQVPRYPFVKEFFEVTVYLFDDSNQVKCGDEFEFPLNVRLMLDDQPRTYVDNGVLEVQPPSPQLGRNGKCTFRVRVRDVSMNFDNRDFVLQVSAVTRASKYYVAPIVSDPMTVIRYRLRIRADSQPPPIWYKDEGGRDKCIEVFVDLVDGAGERVSGEEIPVKVSLLYEDYLPVTKQDILRLSSDSKQVVDGSGTAALRLRIEDVSKNHQSKGFVIKVGPDTQHSPLNSDISPDISTPISVRSKRNRRNKQGGRNEEDMSVVGSAMSLRGSMDLALPVSQNPLHDVPPHLAAPDAKMDAAANPVLKALSSVITWTRTVVNGLYQIQWQLIGYESKPDGSPDITRPLFNIHNPNTIVTNILQSYRNETMDHLRFLVQATEPGGVGLAQGVAQGGAAGREGGVAYGEANGNGNGAAPAYPYGMHPEAMGSGNLYPASRSGQSHGDDHSEPPSLSHAFAYGHHNMDPLADGPSSMPTPTSTGYGAVPPPSSSASAMPPAHPPLMYTTSSAANRPPVPPMMRGKSATLSETLTQDVHMQMIPLQRESTYDLLASMDPSWFNMDMSDTGLQAPGALSSIEAAVAAIMGKVYYSNTYGELGFPAFDHKNTLLGFYREDLNEHQQTVAIYVPLPPSFTDVETRQVVDTFLEELNRGGRDSSIAQIGACNGDLAQLKEKVLTYHWSRSQQGAAGQDGATNGAVSSS